MNKRAHLSLAKRNSYRGNGSLACRLSLCNGTVLMGDVAGLMGVGSELCW